MTAARLPVRLTPRGGLDRIDGVRDGTLSVRVAAAPVEGAANEALLRLLSAELGVPRRAMRVAVGGTARRKLVEIEDERARELIARRWPGLVPG